MESKTPAEQSPSPQGVINQMVMGAWVTKVISEVTRLGVPDLVKQHGSMDASAMVSDWLHDNFGTSIVEGVKQRN